MSNSSITSLVLERLLSDYGPFLSNKDLAEELRLSRAALYNRKSRGQTGGMPEPVRGLHPQQWRAVDIARWITGVSELEFAPPAHSMAKRGPGRPRSLARAASK